MRPRDVAGGVLALTIAAGVGYFFGGKSCKGDPVIVTPPIVRVRDTVEVPPKWMLDFIAAQNKALLAKPRLDTQYLVRSSVVRDSFPYPVYVKDTASRFWWAERATFGKKPGDVTTVVTREPFSGKANVSQYITPGPIESFVIDTSPVPRLTFGTFVQPKKTHGWFLDALLILGSGSAGFTAGATVGCSRG